MHHRRSRTAVPEIFSATLASLTTLSSSTALTEAAFAIAAPAALLEVVLKIVHTFY